MAINPSVTVKELGVNPATSTPLTQINLRAVSNLPSGGLGAVNNIQYTLRSMEPNIGYLARITTPMSPVVFTQAEINTANVIRYVADPTNVTQEYVKLNFAISDLNDPTSRPVNVTLTIRYNFPDRAPEGGTSPLNVWINETKVIQTSNIHFTDIKDPPSAIFMRVQAWPQFGDIYLKGKRIGPGTEFTQDDIDKGRLEYRHNGDREEEIDYLVFKVRDAKNNWSGVVVGEPEEKAPIYTLEIRIRLVDKPIVIRESPLRILQCATHTFTETTLWATDEDDPDLPITFMLKKLPEHGILRKNGTPMVVGTTWTLPDIAAGRITFEQDCSKTPFDSFLIDAYHDRQRTEDYKYVIELIPNQPPIVETIIAPVERCESVVVDETYIKIRDPEGLTPDKLGIEITVLPEHGQLLYDGKPTTKGMKFTYQDILDKKLTYTHDCTVHQPWLDKFEFRVSDEVNVVPATQPFLIQNQRNKPPYMTVNIPHTVPRNSEVTFGIEDANFTDDDGPLEDAYWELTELPLHGTFYINGVPAFVGQKFNQPEWQENTFRYVSSVTDRNILNDFIGFDLYDEFGRTSGNKLLIIFPPPPLLCPETITYPITMSFTKERAITELNLFAFNEGVDPSEFVWTITRAPSWGIMKLNGTQIGETQTFTSQDILLMQLAYQHTRSTPEEDQIELSVTNGFCARDVKFKILFLPGLEIIINKPLEIDQASTGEVIDNTLLQATSGSILSAVELIYTLNSIPTVGVLYLGTTPLARGDKFTQDDINSGRLSYTPDHDQMLQDTDYFSFRLTDGIETLDDVFRINIKLTDRPPEITINELVLGELTCRQVTTVNINVIDRESTDEQLIFRILKNVLYGKLYLRDVELVEGNTFTFADIRLGFVSYCETEEGALLDSFDFSLTDNGGNVLELETLPIRIIPPPPPELLNNGMILNPCTKRAITGVSLNVLNLRTTFDTNLMVFTLTRNTVRGVLERNGVALNVGDTFTLLDIRANLVTYTGFSFRTDPDSFDFTVSSDPFSGEGTFEIKFNNVNNPPWVCFQTELVLFELETRAITYDYLQMCDVDMDEVMVVDPNPDDAETPSETDNWEEGEVITPGDVDPETGIARKTIFLKKPGSEMIVKFKVDFGSAFLTVTDQSNVTLVNTQCRTNSAGELEYRFNTAIANQYLNIMVRTNCFSGPTPAVWNFDIRSVEG